MHPAATASETRKRISPLAARMRASVETNGATTPPVCVDDCLEKASRPDGFVTWLSPGHRKANGVALSIYLLRLALLVLDRARYLILCRCPT
jgi:hypothetical protein